MTWAAISKRDLSEGESFPMSPSGQAVAVFQFRGAFGLAGTSANAMLTLPRIEATVDDVEYVPVSDPIDRPGIYEINGTGLTRLRVVGIPAGVTVTVNVVKLA